MTDGHLTIGDSPDPARDRETILDRLIAFNRQRHGPPASRPFTLTLRDAADRTVGGAYGGTAYGWAFVEVLFVPEEVRGQGYGSRLIAAVETLARERGCLGVWLDTFAFQAPGFYRSLGFVAFGEVPDHPPGSRRIFLLKRLA